MSQTSTVRSAGGQPISVKEMAFTAMMAAVIAICSWISVPIGEVPVTLQTFGVFCAVGLLGGKLGLFSVLVYVLLGAVGVPVFAGFTGGVGILLGSTGGYIIGFIFIALIYWAAEALFGNKFNMVIGIIAMAIGTAVCYTFGTAWFITVYSRKAEIDISTALEWCVTPFLLPDCVKMAAAVLITYRLKKYVRL
ncbi:MAG: biotin transporter BioY [Ruminococcus sp.]|nr:biotin transporter BioY [Ruminococcus sp.]